MTQQEHRGLLLMYFKQGCNPYNSAPVIRVPLRPLSNQTLQTVLAALGPSYRSIDLRALTLRKSTADNTSLACLLLKIRFTREELGDLKQVYDKLKHNIDPGGIYTNSSEKDLLKVQLVGMSIDEVEGLFANIRAGRLKIGGVEYPIVSHVERISNAKPMWYDSYVATKEYLQYRHLLFCSQSDEFLRAYLDREIVDYAYDFAISTLMDLPSLEIVQANNLIILFPVYCRSLPTDEKERSISANYEVNRSLVEHCRVVASKTTGEPREVSVEMKECHSETLGEMKILTIPLSFSVSHNDVVEINVLHEILGSISERRVYGDSILNPPYGHDLLIDAFREFESNLRFSEYLISNAHETRKVSMQHRLICSSVWLLNMIGYRSIPLGLLDTSDENTIGEVHSCDILACDDAKLLVLDLHLPRLLRTKWIVSAIRMPSCETNLGEEAQLFLSLSAMIIVLQ